MTDFTRPVRTRGGFPARVLATDDTSIPGYPVVAEVEDAGTWKRRFFTAEGRYSLDYEPSGHLYDLMNV
jgi:hypothetical protein